MALSNPIYYSKNEVKTLKKRYLGQRTIEKNHALKRRFEHWSQKCGILVNPILSPFLVVFFFYKFYNLILIYAR
jgi:hypothetical protein